MSNVIPLFIEDEITGLMRPNVGSPAEYWLCNKWNQAERMTFQRGQAVAWLAQKGEGWYIHCLPATKPWCEK